MLHADRIHQDDPTGRGPEREELGLGQLVGRSVGGQSADWLVGWVGETAEIGSGELGEGLAEVECVLPLGF